MIKSVLNKILINVTLLFLVLSCTKGNQSKWTGEGFINKKGKYITKAEKYTIDVTDENNVIAFKVYDANNNSIIKSSRNVSSIQSWFLFWDTKNKALWLYSSDIGSSYWITDINNVYHEFIITNINKVKIPVEIPEDIQLKIME